MTVEIVAVGTELLLGNIINTNAAYMAEKCADAGLSCFFQDVVGDNEDRLKQVIECALQRSDLVILSGGLGPTEDDLTKETAAKVLGRELIMHEPSRKAIEDYFVKRNLRPTANNWKQALVPEGCIVIANDNGTAPGIIVEKEEKKVILLPGPPNELVPMFEKSIMPYLQKEQSGRICSATVKICGVGESKAETQIKDLIESQSNPTIAPYAKNCEVHLRITAKAENQKAGEALIQPVVKELRNRFGKAVYTTDTSETLESTVVALLKEKGLTLAAAESCTGGLFSGRLIQVPGASEVFESGYITYSNESKRRSLGVSKKILKEYGAVSKKCAKAMAKGAIKASGADLSIAITGIAGPGGGTEEKPVGLVYIACCNGDTVKVRKELFSGNRSKIRETAVSIALILLRECLLELTDKL